MYKFKAIILSTLILVLTSLPAGCSSIGKTIGPAGPTAIVIDDETGKPIEGAVAIAIWRGNIKDCNFIQGLHGGCFGFLKAEEVVSDKEGNINIPDFWKTTYKKGGTGNVYDPRLTVYKFGYVCWDQQRIFQPDNRWGDRKDFDRDNRVVRLKKWPEGMSFYEHSSFMSEVTDGDYSKSKDHLLIKAFKEEDTFLIKENIKKYNLK